MPESSSLGTPFGNQRVNGSERLLKHAMQHFYPNFLLILDKLNLKTSLLFTSEMLGLFFYTLMVYHMYSPQNWKKFKQ